MDIEAGARADKLYRTERRQSVERNSGHYVLRYELSPVYGYQEELEKF